MDPRNSADIILERGRRLSEISRSAQVVRAFPLLVECAVAETLFAMLRHATAHYILASLRCAYPGKAFALAGNVLEDHRADILKLPNRTPNGKLAAKQEIAGEFNLVQKCVELIFRQLGLDTHAERVQLPVIVRVQDGRPDPAVENRPYATSKIHSDIWTGEAADSATVIIPVLGDIAGTGLNFYEPEVPRLEDFVRTFDDYLETQKFIKTMKQYDCPMSPTCVYVFDSFCLHETVKKGGGIRVSIDYRFFQSRKLPSDVQHNWSRQTNYVPTADWFTLERNTFLEPTETMGDAIRKYAGAPLSAGGAGGKAEFTVVPCLSTSTRG